MEQEFVVALFRLENAHRIADALEPIHLLGVTHCDWDGRDKDHHPDTQNGSGTRISGVSTIREMNGE